MTVYAKIIIIIIVVQLLYSCKFITFFSFISAQGVKAGVVVI